MHAKTLYGPYDTGSRAAVNSNVGLHELQSQYVVSMQECTRSHPQQYAILKKLAGTQTPNRYATRLA